MRDFLQAVQADIHIPWRCAICYLPFRRTEHFLEDGIKNTQAASKKNALAQKKKGTGLFAVKTLSADLAAICGKFCQSLLRHRSFVRFGRGYTIRTQGILQRKKHLPECRNVI